MKLHPDVLEDLLVLYNAGEASPATRELVEQHLAADPELARRAAAAGAGEPVMPAATPPPTGELAAVDRTRKLLKQRSQAMAVALVFTILPLSIVVRGGEITFLLVRDEPKIAAAWWFTAAVMWVYYALIRRRMRPPKI